MGKVNGREANPGMVCRFNIGVDCWNRANVDCGKCGWNPSVSKKRKKAAKKLWQGTAAKP